MDRIEISRSGHDVIISEKVGDNGVVDFVRIYCICWWCRVKRRLLHWWQARRLKYVAIGGQVDE